MIRASSLILGIGLVVLWLVGLGQHATPWLTWLDGIAALVAFAIAASVANATVGVSAGGGPIALAVGLFVLWIVALVSHASTWLAWWTFVFAIAFLIAGGVASVQTTHPTVRRTI